MKVIFDLLGIPYLYKIDGIIRREKQTNYFIGFSKYSSYLNGFKGIFSGAVNLKKLTF